MSDEIFARAPGHPAPIPDPHAKTVFSHGLAPFPASGPAVLVIAADWCPHCHQAGRANSYAERTANGLPVVWLNDAYQRMHDRLAAMPGVTSEARSFLDEKGNTQSYTALIIGGKELEGYPTVVEIVDGKATRILDVDISQAGALDRVGNQIVAEAKAKNAVNTPGGGTSVPQKPASNEQGTARST